MPMTPTIIHDLKRRHMRPASQIARGMLDVLFRAHPSRVRYDFELLLRAIPSLSGNAATLFMRGELVRTVNHQSLVPAGKLIPPFRQPYALSLLPYIRTAFELQHPGWEKKSERFSLHLLGIDEFSIPPDETWFWATFEDTRPLPVKNMEELWIRAQLEFRWLRAD